MVDRIIKISEQQLHTSCPVAEKITYLQKLVQTRDSELAEYSRVVCVHLTKISDLESQIENLESQIENLKGQLKEQTINQSEVEILKDNNSKLEELLSSTRDALENVLYELQ